MSGHLIRLFHASPYSLDEIYNPMFSNKDNKKGNIEITNPDRLFENTEFLGKTSNDPIPDIVGFDTFTHHLLYDTKIKLFSTLEVLVKSLLKCEILMKMIQATNFLHLHLI